jgi:hypothetical protein
VFEWIKNDPNYQTVGVNYSLIEQLSGVLADIAAKRLPPEVAFNQNKLDQVANKIKFVPVPKSI